MRASCQLAGLFKRDFYNVTSASTPAERRMPERRMPARHPTTTPSAHPPPPHKAFMTSRRPTYPSSSRTTRKTQVPHGEATQKHHRPAPFYEPPRILTAGLGCDKTRLIPDVMYVTGAHAVRCLFSSFRGVCWRCQRRGFDRPTLLRDTAKINVDLVGFEWSGVRRGLVRRWCLTRPGSTAVRRTVNVSKRPLSWRRRCSLSRTAPSDLIKVDGRARQSRLGTGLPRGPACNPPRHNVTASSLCLGPRDPLPEFPLSFLISWCEVTREPGIPAPIDPALA